MRLLLTAGGVIIATGLFAFDAHADESAPGSSPRLTEAPITVTEDAVEQKKPSLRLQLEATTEVPVLVGGMLSVELPGRLHIGGGIGATPQAYFDAIGSVATGIGGLSEAEADVVQSALDAKWAARVFIGWRPFPDAGFYMRFGYQMLRLDGQMTSADALSMVTSVPVAGVSGQLQMSSNLHMLYGELGYRWALDPVTVRLSVGFAGTVGSDVDLALTGSPNAAVTDPLLAAGEDYLKDGFRSYVMTPTVGLAVGFDIGL